VHTFTDYQRGVLELTESTKLSEVFYKTLYVTCDVRVSVTTKSPLRIGAGKGLMIDEPDLPVIRGGNGEPIIPASSLKGVFRSSLVRLLRVAEENLTLIFGGEVSQPSKNERFSIASPIVFCDLVPSGKVKTFERYHIRINPVTGGVSNLFEVEYVPEGVIFEGRIITRNFPLTIFSGILNVMCILFNDDIVRIGGFKSRGYGSIEVKYTEPKVQLPQKVNFLTRLGSIRNQTSQISLEVDSQRDKLKLLEKVDGKTYQYEISIKQKQQSVLGLHNVFLDQNEFQKIGEEVLSNWLTPK
jgi:CRISPR-associated protein Csm3